MTNKNSSSIIRVFAGGYLLYLAYQLINSIRTEDIDNKIWLILATVLFIVSGAGILYIGVKGLMEQKKMSDAEIADEELNEELEAEEEAYGMYAEPALKEGKMRGIERELEKLKAEDEKGEAETNESAKDILKDND